MNNDPLNVLDQNIKKIHYVGPTSAWLSNKDTSSLHHIIDHLLLLYPFELKYYTHGKYGVTYVGHPLLEDCMQEETSEYRRGDRSIFRSHIFKEFQLDSSAQIIGVLPGSRQQEVTRMLPIFLDAAKLLQKSVNKQIHLVVPTIPHLFDSVQRRLNSLPRGANMSYSVVDSTNTSVKYDALAVCCKKFSIFIFAGV